MVATPPAAGAALVPGCRVLAAAVAVAATNASCDRSSLRETIRHGIQSERRSAIATASVKTQKSGVFNDIPSIVSSQPENDKPASESQTRDAWLDRWCASIDGLEVEAAHFISDYPFGGELLNEW